MTLNVLLATPLAESVTCAVKLNVPEAVGVPLRIPVLLPRDNPLGNVPEETVQEYGAVPKLVERVWE